VGNLICRAGECGSVCGPTTGKWGLLLPKSAVNKCSLIKLFETVTLQEHVWHISKHLRWHHWWVTSFAMLESGVAGHADDVLEVDGGSTRAP
jgi:hypothetical protein